jgi:hypothetical protein
MRVGELLWLPVRVLWAVIKASVIPVGITLLAWWLLPDSWARWITAAMVVWVVVVILLIAAKVNGQVRSLQRGPLYVQGIDDDWL